jgi:hypothetical protein
MARSVALSLQVSFFVWFLSFFCASAQSTGFPDFCKGKEKGDYLDPEKACSGRVYTCKSDGTLLIRNCPADLVFFAEQSVCAKKFHVAACNESIDTTSTKSIDTTSSKIDGTSSKSIDTTLSKSIDTTSSKSIDTTSSKSIDTTSSKSIDTTSSKSIDTSSSKSIDTTSLHEMLSTVGIETSTVFSCSNRLNGYYGDTTNPCSGRFYKCTEDGHMIKMQCPERFIFHSEIDDVTQASCVANSTASCESAVNKMTSPAAGFDQDSSPETVSRSTLPADNTVPSETISHSTVHSELTSHSAVSAETTGHSMVSGDTSSHSIVLAETTSHNIIQAENTSHSIVPAETTSHSIVPAETTSHSIVPAETTSHNIVPAENTSQSIVPGETTSHSIVPAETTSHNIVPAENTSQSIVPADSSIPVYVPASHSQLENSTLPADVTGHSQLENSTLPAGGTSDHTTMTAFESTKTIDGHPTVETATSGDHTAIPTTSDMKGYIDFCINKTSGDHLDPEHACSGRVFTCKHDGSLLIRNCPADLVFFVEKSACAEKIHVDACRNEIASSKSIGATTSKSIDTTTKLINTTSFPPETLSTLWSLGIQTEPSTEFSCSGRSAGYYGDATNPCAGRFYKCAKDGQLSKMQCPEDFIFHAELDVTQAFCVANSTASCESATSKLTSPETGFEGDSSPETVSRSSLPADMTVAADATSHITVPAETTSQRENSTSADASSNHTMMTAFESTTTIDGHPAVENATSSDHTAVPTRSGHTAVSTTPDMKGFIDFCVNKTSGDYVDPEQACSGRVFTCQHNGTLLIRNLLT